MKKFQILFLLIFSFLIGKAQEKLVPVTTPSSPASYILGIQPSSVLTPKSYKALEAAVYSNFLNNEGNAVLPSSFALEFTPYWASDHGQSFKNILLDKTDLWEKFIRNLSVSVASSQKFLLEDKTESNSLAMGIRSSFFFASNTDKTKVNELLKRLYTVLNWTARLSSIAAPLKVSATDNADFKVKFLVEVKKVINAKYDPEAAKSFYDKFEQALNSPTAVNYKDEDFNDWIKSTLVKIDKEEGETASDALKKYLERRNGLTIDVAYSSFINFPSNKFNYSFVPRQAAWVNPTYKLEKIFNIGAILRYEWYNTSYYAKYFPTAKNFRNNFDYGLSIAAEFKNFTLQMEAVGRNQKTEIVAGVSPLGAKLYTKETSSDFQCVGTVAYRISNQIALSYTIGQGFKPIINPENTLVSLLSLNFGFGGPKVPQAESNK